MIDHLEIMESYDEYDDNVDNILYPSIIYIENIGNREIIEYRVDPMIGNSYITVDTDTVNGVFLCDNGNNMLIFPDKK